MSMSRPNGVAEPLLRAVQVRPKHIVPEASRIRVHAAISRFSVLYEKIRNAVDYKDDHLLRKAAILRILKRHLVLERQPGIIAEHLVRELIGARYLPNDEMDEAKIVEATKVIQKYLAIERVKLVSQKQLEWLRGIIAVELEDLLVDSTSEKLLTTFLYERITDHVKVSGSVLTLNEVRLQSYLAIHRTFLKADDDMVSYKLLRAFLPEWMRPQDWIERPQAMAERLIGVERRMQLTMGARESQAFLRGIRPWSVSLRILVQVLMEKSDKAEALLSKQKELDEVVTRIAERQYQEANARLRRGALRATVYLFVTKMLVAFLLEVPVELLWYHEVFIPSLLVNMLFPPILMFVVSLFIRIPGKENTRKIVSNVHALLGLEPIQPIDLRFGQQRRGSPRWVFSLVYGFTFALIFGLIMLGLHALDFTWISGAIFVFFLCVVSFFAFRLRLNAREFVVVQPKQTASIAFMDFVSLPILRAGQWLSKSISRINVFLFFFDFLFEAPFKIFLSVMEEWLQFIKEKKEELQ